MQILGIGPGPLVGEIIKALEKAQPEGRVSTREEAGEFIKGYYESLKQGGSYE